MSATIERACERRPYPIHVRLEGRRVVVVGGGRIAVARAGELLDAGAHVLVTSAEPSPDLAALADEGRIVLCRREFERSDLEGAWMVHAVSEDPETNDAVVAAVRAVRDGGTPILVGLSDATSPDGDFLLPTAFDHGRVTVSVCRFGSDERKPRDMKTLLHRQLDAVVGADLTVIGVDQRGLELEALERVCRQAGDERRLEATLAALRPVDEFFILHTCNRFEVYMIAGADPIVEELVTHGMRLHRVRPDQRYVLRGRDAFVHLSLVLAGAYADLFGETAIVAQVKDAVARARAGQTAGPRLARYIDEALNVSRRVRTAVMAGLESREAEDLCAGRLAADRPELDRETVLVVGTGAVGRAVMNRIASRPKKIYWAFFRRAPSLEGLPPGNVEVISVDRIPEVIGLSDVVIVASGAKEPVVRDEHAKALEGRSTLLLDLSVPRGVAPSLGSVPGVRLVHLQELVSTARSCDVPSLVRMSEASARRESYRFLRSGAA